jgi:hypothetical protein
MSAEHSPEATPTHGGLALRDLTLSSDGEDTRFTLTFNTERSDTGIERSNTGTEGGDMGMERGDVGMEMERGGLRMGVNNMGIDIGREREVNGDSTINAGVQEGMKVCNMGMERGRNGMEARNDIGHMEVKGVEGCNNVAEGYNTATLSFDSLTISTPSKHLSHEDEQGSPLPPPPPTLCALEGMDE